MKSQNEIEQMLDKVMQHKERIETVYKGMTYAEGLENALRWAMGQDAELLDEAELEVVE